MAVPVEPYQAGLERLMEGIANRIGRKDVTVMEGNASDMRGSPPSVIVYDPSAPSLRSTGTPLLVTVLCANRASWPLIHAALEAEGFEPLTPEPGEGRVCYASRTRALLLVPEHPGANRAVEMTGTALLTTIV